MTHIRTEAAIAAAAKRYDAVDKVMGTARYSSDFDLPHAVHAYLVTSTVARGRIKGFDLQQARSVRGVLDVLTHVDIGEQIKPVKVVADGGFAFSTSLPMRSAAISYPGQIIALVLAETYEIARQAAHLVRVDYAVERATAGMDSVGATRLPLSGEKKAFRNAVKGDFAAGYERGAVKVDATYNTPPQHHNPMELYATQCAWHGGKLTVYEGSQNLTRLKNGIAAQLGMPVSDVRVISHFSGGAFGARSSLTPRTALIALAAKRLGRPVMLVATREQGFTAATYRGETRQRVLLAAERDGTLVALSHEGVEVTSRDDTQVVAGTGVSTRIYACPNIASNVDVVRVDRSAPGPMRAPAEQPYFFGLESAMDEMAVALGMDPVALRLRNDTQNDAINGAPFSSRSLAACYAQASEAFGWKRRTPAPRSMRDGDWLVGWGCATSVYPTYMSPSSARIRIHADGRVRIEAGMHELGNGAYTVVAQTAAERLGVTLDKVEVAWADTDLPPAATSGGSVGTASLCTTVATACDRILQEVGVDSSAALLPAMRARGRGSVERYVEWLPQGFKPESVGQLYTGNAWPVGGMTSAERALCAFGAQMVEVRVHRRTREIRVPRIVGAFACGRVMNARTAHSQLTGSMIWGISSALHEQTEIDEKTARYVNTNLADYLVPVNADIGSVEAFFVPEEDTLVNPLGIKGLGEIGVVGTAAAVCNAIYHATGKRLRDLPVRIEHLLG